MTDNEVINGNWFLPEQEENHFNGQLSFGPSTPTRLTIVATLNTNLSMFPFGGGEYTIWGYNLDGQPITLFECNRLTLGGTASIEQATFNAHSIIIGKHVNAASSKDFTGVRFSVNNLDRWLEQNGYEIKVRSWTEYDVSYRRPPDLMFNLDDNTTGTLTVWNNVPFGAAEKIELLRSSFIELKFENGISLDAVMKYVYRFQQFLSTMMFTTISVRTIYLMFDTQQIRLFYRQADKALEDERDLFLIRFSFIKDSFESLIKKWFDVSSTMAPIVNILYANIGESGEFVHNNFLNIVQAVEAFHRRRIQDTEKLKEDNIVLVSRILTQIENEEDKKWLQERLYFSYEPSLRKRLKELIALNSHVLFTEPPSTKEINKIIKEVVDKRNYYTHYDPSLEKEQEDLFVLNRLTQVLKLLLTYSLLNEIGLSASYLSEKVYKRFRVRLA